MLLAVLVIAAACSSTGSEPNGVDYYPKLTSLVNKLNDQNRQLIDRNLRQNTPAVSDDNSQATDEAGVRESYREFVTDVGAFADGLESIEPPSSAKSAHVRMVAASRELARVDAQVGELFDAAHTPVNTDAGLDAQNRQAIVEWRDACFELEKLGVNEKTTTFRLSCSEVVRQESGQ